MEVSVAKGRLPAMTFIKDVDTFFETRRLPKASVPADAVLHREELRNRFLGHPLAQGEVCTTKHLLDEGVTRAMSIDHRAMPVRVAEDNEASIFEPGMRVDAIASMPDHKDPRLKLSKTFLQDILVLGQQKRVVILAVLPNDCEKLAWAQDNGALRLVLRKRGDDKIGKTLGATGLFGRLFLEPEPGQGQEGR